MRREIIECDGCGVEIGYRPGVPVPPLQLQIFVNGAACRQPDGSLYLDFCSACTERIAASLPRLLELIRARADTQADERNRALVEADARRQRTEDRRGS